MSGRPWFAETRRAPGLGIARRAGGRIALVFIAGLWLTTPTHAQSGEQSLGAGGVWGSARADCPDAPDLTAPDLYGDWVLTWPGKAEAGQLRFTRHPEFRDSLRGELRYGGAQSLASGDLESGELNLDESRDGKSLFAFWTGSITPGSCGREIRGRWEPVPKEGQSATPTSDFVLRRPGYTGGW